MLANCWIGDISYKPSIMIRTTEQRKLVDGRRITVQAVISSPSANMRRNHVVCRRLYPCLQVLSALVCGLADVTAGLLIHAMLSVTRPLIASRWWHNDRRRGRVPQAWGLEGAGWWLAAQQSVPGWHELPAVQSGGRTVWQVLSHPFKPHVDYQWVQSNWGILKT